MAKDLYEKLGVDEGAEHEEIRAAFRKQAKKLHPDVGGDADDFAALVLAHDVLSDDAKRALYDETGEVRSANFEEEGARAMLVQEMMETFKATDDIKSVELVETMKVGLVRRQEKVEKEIGSAEEGIKNIAVIRERLKYSGTGESHLHLVLDNNRIALEKRILNLQRELRITELALELLDDYDYQADAFEYSWFGRMGGTTITA